MSPEPSAQSRRTREQIYLAILTVAFRRGFGHVTIDAVADEARISKGWILYHFRTKAAMIESLVAACAACTTLSSGPRRQQSWGAAGQCLGFGSPDRRGRKSRPSKFGIEGSRSACANDAGALLSCLLDEIQLGGDLPGGRGADVK